MNFQAALHTAGGRTARDLLWQFLLQHSESAPALELVRDYVLTLSGDIQIRCEFVGGSCFRFVIPRSSSHELARAYQGDILDFIRRLYSELYEDLQLELRIRQIRERVEHISRQDWTAAFIHDYQIAAERQIAALRASHYQNRARDTLSEHELIQRQASAIARAQDEFTVFGTAIQMQIYPPLVCNDLNTPAVMRQIRDMIEFSFQQQVYFLDAADDVGSKKARERAEKLLRKNLSPAQRAQLKKNDWFEVRGSDTGKTYRIKRGRQMNIRELDGEGREVCTWCFLPEGQCPAGDVMLAQKIALENFETGALRIANRFGSCLDFPGMRLIPDSAADRHPSIWHRFRAMFTPSG